MKLEYYRDQRLRLPSDGKQVIGQLRENDIIVYQAFNPGIADYAVKHQRFGGPHYSFDRMSWIKPGFLWMMHRAGWARKEHQQRILAITLPMIHFETILRNATISSFDPMLFPDETTWKEELNRTDVRLQWDPDHDPEGNKQLRKAIQVGMKGTTLRQFCTAWIEKIEDITAFVQAQHQNVQINRLDALLVPYEEVAIIQDDEINQRIGCPRQKVQ